MRSYTRTANRRARTRTVPRHHVRPRAAPAPMTRPTIYYPLASLTLIFPAFLLVPLFSYTPPFQFLLIRGGESICRVNAAPQHPPHLFSYAAVLLICIAWFAYLTNRRAGQTATPVYRRRTHRSRRLRDE